jgi:DNA-directed RNA polymerase subunit RPC12/RpoP
MKLTGKQIGITVTASVTGLFAGALLVSGGIRIQLLSLAGLLALPPVAVGLIVADTRAQGKVNQAEAKADEALRSLDGMTIKLTASEEKEARLQVELAEIQNSLNRAKELLKACEVERSQSAEVIGQQYLKIDELQAALVSHQEQVEALEVEIEVWEEEFHSKLNIEAEKRFQAAKLAEIKRIESENDALTKEAIEIARQYRQWANLADARLQGRREFVENITSSYNSKISDFGQSYSKQVSGYLEQIEILNCKVAALQQKLQGDLVQPEYGQFGYAVEGKIANDIARRVWEELQIPLAVKGYQVKPDGSTDVGYGFSRSVPVDALLSDLSRHSGDIAKSLGLHKITNVRKLEISDLLVLTFRREPALKESEINQLVGTAQEFTRYIVSNQIRYRLIADPHSGKTPTTAVMLSAILSSGTRQANTEKGAKVPHTLVAVAYPGRESSLKDERYPLDLFLKYATEASAVKSFGDAVEDWKYRKTHTSYAKQFFQIWCWDEFDNTIASASDPKGVAEDIKQLLKQAHHTNQGWIFSGQSVMTSQIPGFTNDDRSLFIEIVIGIPKIRKYIETYGKQRNSDETLNKLRKNLDAIQDYVEHQNERITDEARQLRVALVMDSRSPKLFFLPNLDDVDFDVSVITESEKLASQVKSGSGVHPSPASSGSPDAEKYNVDGASVTAVPSGRPKSTIPHCPECGSSNVSALKDGRYRCKDCGVKRAVSKVIWK